MVYELKNKQLTVKVDSLGAQLISVVGSSQTEYIWQRDPQHWSSCAPVLFPIVGRLNNGEYLLNGQRYQMASHGFCRTSEFALVQHTADTLCLKLAYNDTTLAQYPFLFELLVTFVLAGNRVEVRYEVINQDNKTLYFSIGGHPGFALPWSAGEVFTDYYLEFEQPETAHIHEVTDDKFLKRETLLMLDKQSTLPLSYDLFAIDALIFDDLQSDKVSIRSTKNSRSIDFEYPGFTSFAVWTKPGAPYLCLEPWYGHGDYYDYTGNFEDREGTLSLDAGQSFACAYTFAINE